MICTDGCGGPAIWENNDPAQRVPMAGRPRRRLAAARHQNAVNAARTPHGNVVAGGEDGRARASPPIAEADTLATEGLTLATRLGEEPSTRKSELLVARGHGRSGTWASCLAATEQFSGSAATSPKNSTATTCASARKPAWDLSYARGRRITPNRSSTSSKASSAGREDGTIRASPRLLNYARQRLPPVAKDYAACAQDYFERSLASGGATTGPTSASLRIVRLNLGEIANRYGRPGAGRQAPG